MCLVLLYPSAGTGRQDNLKIYWYDIVNVQVVFRITFIYKGGHSLNGKTAILHIAISGSSPDVSIYSNIPGYKRIKIVNPK
jgi:hypothetical protein